MPYIYALPVYKVLSTVIVSIIIWIILTCCLSKKAMRFFSGLLLPFALCGVLYYSVLHRTTSGQHIFSFFASWSNEFYREMIMNIFLYFPSGLALSSLTGPWSILAAFILSLGIETWQYFAGTGLAQGTDVIMNTLGAAIGALPWVIVNIIKKHTSAESGSD